MWRALLFFNLLIWVVYPFIGKAQNALQLEWIKPMDGTLEHRRLESIANNGGQLLMSGFISLVDTPFGCTHCTSEGNAWLLMSDSNGEKTFSHCYGGSSGDGFYHACYGKSGSIWAMGYFNATDGDFPNTTGKILGVVKFDSTYTPLWYNFYGSKGDNEFGDFIATSDGGALLLASTNDTSGNIHNLYGNNPFNFDAYLCKLDSAGNIKWLLLLGGSGNQSPVKAREFLPNKYSVLIYTNSTDYMLTGLNSDSIDMSPWFLEIDTGGHILSSRVEQNVGIAYDDFTPKRNGGLLLGGTSNPDSSDFCYPGLGESDFALMEIDSDFQPEWCKVMGGSGNDLLEYMTIINDSVVAISGVSESINGDLLRCSDFGTAWHGWLGLVNTNTLELTWQTSFCDSINVIMEGIAYDSASQSLYLLVFGGVDGDFASAAISGTTSNTYLFKYHLTTTTGINQVNKLNTALSLYPNPTSNECLLKIDEPNQMSNATVFDAVGRQIMSLFNGQQLSTFNINCNRLSPGLYFVKVTDYEGRVGVVKMVKE